MELLFQLYGDPTVEAIFGVEQTVGSWLTVEAALARALGDARVIPAEQASAIADVCELHNIDQVRLWEETRVVGYPILPLVRMICRALPAEAAGFVHWGATTQDIMDTALALQVGAAMRRLSVLVEQFGSGVAEVVQGHRGTVMAARTHGQQAVPTTFGAKCAPLLDQLARDRGRLARCARTVATVSLFGAGGSSAALSPSAGEVRAALAGRLDLADAVVPWHTARDRLVEAALSATLAAQTAVRFAREVVDLSRTEIGEVAEGDGEYRGASSTMPQKANPVMGEAVIGFGASGAAMVGGLLRSMEVQQERAAGEWQVEWQALPYVLRSAAGAVSVAGQLANSLRVFAGRMLRNMLLDEGLVMAEAYMVRLAGRLGRDKAHEAVYRAARLSRARHLPLWETLDDCVGSDVMASIGPLPIDVHEYLGDVDAICDSALAMWRSRGDGR